MTTENQVPENQIPDNTPEEKAPEYTKIELEAMDMGWRPKSEFNGDEDDFIAAIRKSDIGGLFPKIVYKPPRRSRSKYFEPGGQCGDTCGDTCDQYELLASATCIMPGGSYMPVETYDFSPFELAYVTAEQCRGQMSVFLMIVKRLNLPIPQGVRQMVYLHLVKTSNRGFHLG